MMNYCKTYNKQNDCNWYRNNKGACIDCSYKIFVPSYKGDIQDVEVETKAGNIIELEVYYDFIPGEKMIWNYGDGSGYPGTAPRVVVNHVVYNDREITKLIRTGEIEEHILNQIID